MRLAAELLPIGFKAGETNTKHAIPPVFRYSGTARRLRYMIGAGRQWMANRVILAKDAAFTCGIPGQHMPVQMPVAF
jgi:hypothetical protein